MPPPPHFRRLLWRCGFSGSDAQIAHYRSLGLNGAIENLLAPRSPAKLSGPAPKVNGGPIDPINAWGHDTLWWLDRMVRSHNQLEERMTLNLHDHFATSNSGVGNTRHMLRQNKLLRSHAVGNFLDLVTRLTHDPAMLLWLNGADSNRWAPNENYARELMELFCLGNDPALEAATFGLWKQSKVYTQADIHAAALALTGWRYDWNKASNGNAAQRENPTFYDSSAGTRPGRRRSSATPGRGTGRTSSGSSCATRTTRRSWRGSCGRTSSRRRRPSRRCR